MTCNAKEPKSRSVEGQMSHNRVFFVLNIQYIKDSASVSTITVTVLIREKLKKKINNLSYFSFTNISRSQSCSHTLCLY